MVTIKDVAQDIVKNVISTGFFDKIKIESDGKTVTIESMDKDKEVILKGKIVRPVPDLKGVFGLSNLNLLSHIVSDSEFTMDESKLSVTYATREKEDIPTEFAYTNKSKSHINYRLMPSTMIPNQPKFLEPKWDVLVTPTKAQIQQFAWAANGLNEYEEYYIPKIVNESLKFFIGDENSASQRGGVVMATEQTGTFDNTNRWKIAKTITVLKLAERSEFSMAFSTRGAIQVSVNTGIGEYKYILPCKVS
jgi:hypothetical protein